MSDYPAKKQFNTPIAQTALNEMKLRLYAAVPDQKRKATLGVTAIANNVHLVVYTNVEGDANRGIIRGRLDALTFFAILQALADVIEGEKDEAGKYPSFRVPCKRPKPGGTFGDLVTESWVHIARQDDGRIYIALTDGQATNVQFYFGPTDFHDEWTFNGKPIDQSRLSAVYANAWGRIMNNLTPVVLALNLKSVTTLAVISLLDKSLITTTLQELQL
jgi:hypothetical protein